MSPIISVTPASRALPSLLSLIFAIQDDPALDDVSLPRVNDREGILAWMEAEKWRMWLVRVDGETAGILSLHPPRLTEDAEPYRDHLETDTYLIPDCRGYGVATLAWREVFAELPAGTQLVAEVWESNRASCRRLEKSGWVFAGEHLWTGDGMAGMCRRYTLAL